MKFLISAFLLLFFISVRAQSKSLSPQEFQTAIAEGKVQLLDVRTLEEFLEFSIKGALLANWNDSTAFQNGISQLDSTKTVYIYCKSGRRSAAAQEYMLANGFREVINLSGGIMGWKEAGLPTQSPATKKRRAKKK